MQRLFQFLPSSSRRIAQTSRTLGLNPSNYPAALTAVCRNARFITSPSHPAATAMESIPTVSTSTPEDRWKERSRDAQDPLRRRPNDEYTGRSVGATGKNLASAFKKLDQILMRNSVRQELRMAERHEKKGVKRRRLQSQRWKNRFANEVREKVKLVNKIRKRGA